MNIRGRILIINILNRLTIITMLMCMGFSAQAGHLFTQAASNTPIVLTAGQGIDLPQDSLEQPASPTSQSRLHLQNFDSGDILRMEIGGVVRVLDFDNMLAGWTATATSIIAPAGNDPELAALNLATPFSWRIDAVAGDFTVEGFRIYIANGTVNGTGTGAVNQSQITPSGGATATPIPLLSPVGIVILAFSLAGIGAFKRRHSS